MPTGPIDDPPEHVMGLDRIVDDLGAMVADPSVWWALAVTVVVAVVATAIGLVIGRRCGMVDAGAPVADQLGVGAALGLTACAVAYASLRSGGKSAYVPALVLIGMAAVVGRGRLAIGLPRRSWGPIALGAGLLILTSAILYGATVAPSPRDGVQPITFMDEAYYAVLGADLRATGLEDVYSPAGLGRLPGTPAQSLYHWGEIWLAALLQDVAGVSAMLARYVAVLPLLIASTAMLVGAMAAARTGRERRREAVVLGVIGMIGIAPVPLFLEWHFDWWARAIGFSVTNYGLAYPIVALGLRSLLTGPGRVGRAHAVLIGGLVAALVASHILIAALAAVAVGVAGAFRWWLDGRHAAWLRETRGPVIASLVGGLATMAWALLTGHGFASAGSVVGADPFGPAWLRAILLTVLGSGVIAIGAILALRRSSVEPRLASVAAGALAAVATGAMLWGARIADFNFFHVYFGAIAVLLTPVAVIATVRAIGEARARRSVAAPVLLVILLCQSAVGVGATIQRLYEFGPGHYEPVPVAALDQIRDLPANAKLAYSCATYEEVAVWDARLIAVSALTGRDLVPMCFQGDVFRNQLGLEPDPRLPGPFFDLAPQKTLYPALDEPPSAEAIRAFMRAHGIEYVWVDPDHPNALVGDPVEVFRDDGFAILRLPDAP